MPTMALVIKISEIKPNNQFCSIVCSKLPIHATNHWAKDSMLPKRKNIETIKKAMVRTKEKRLTSKTLEEKRSPREEKKILGLSFIVYCIALPLTLSAPFFITSSYITKSPSTLPFAKSSGEVKERASSVF